jgi:NAD-dependent dihydropyrimidine dehydrogenase PreA subunit
MDKSCVQECPVSCIYEGSRMLYIHPDECIDCGACEPVCPQEAIHYDGLIPAEQREFLDINRTVFDSLGSPGGQAAVPTPIADHPVVDERYPKAAAE